MRNSRFTWQPEDLEVVPPSSGLVTLFHVEDYLLDTGRHDAALRVRGCINAVINEVTAHHKRMAAL